MKVKLLELRDEGTFIALLCVDMNPDRDPNDKGAIYYGQSYLLRRCGYPCDGRPNIAITHLAANGTPCWNDPYAWRGRTYPVAHNYIIENWASLRDGDVIDVQFILGETSTPKIRECLEAEKK
jgi:hypothetical protein